MNVSFAELVVLAAVGRTPKSKEELAQVAASMYPSTKFDARLALVDIRNLTDRRLLQDYKGKLELTRDGWAELVNSLSFIENMRAAVAGASYNVLGAR